MSLWSVSLHSFNLNSFQSEVSSAAMSLYLLPFKAAMYVKIHINYFTRARLSTMVFQHKRKKQTLKRKENAKLEINTKWKKISVSRIYCFFLIGKGTCEMFTTNPLCMLTTQLPFDMPTGPPPTILGLLWIKQFTADSSARKAETHTQASTQSI